MRRRTVSMTSQKVKGISGDSAGSNYHLPLDPLRQTTGYEEGKIVITNDDDKIRRECSKRNVT